MTPGDTHPRLGGGGFAAELANLSHLLDVLDDVIAADYSWAAPAGHKPLESERAAARAFLDELRTFAPAVPASSWPDHALVKLLDVIGELGELHDELERTGDATRLVDTRQPGSVPGPQPGDLPTGSLRIHIDSSNPAAFADAIGFPFQRVEPIPGIVDSTPAPEYRAPIATPEPGAEWRCASCGRRRPEHGHYGDRSQPPTSCSCGGEWVLVDAGGGLEDPRVSRDWRAWRELDPASAEAWAARAFPFAPDAGDGETAKDADPRVEGA